MRHDRNNYFGTDQNHAKRCYLRDNMIDVAIKEAKRSPMLQKHGCIVVHNNRVVSSAHNHMPPMFQNSVHAEVNALKKIKHKSALLKECDLYIVRIGPDSSQNALKYSKPCAACARFITSCGIRSVFYSTNYEYDLYCKALKPLSTHSTSRTPARCQSRLACA